MTQKPYNPESSGERRTNDTRLALVEKSIKDLEKLQAKYEDSIASVHKRISETRTLTLREMKDNSKELSDSMDTKLDKFSAALDEKLKVFTDKFDACARHIGQTSVLFKALSYIEWTIYILGAGLLVIFGWIYTHATGADHTTIHQLLGHLKKLKAGG